MREIEDMHRRLMHVAAVMAAVLMFGTAGYMLIAKWPFFESLYMTVITLASHSVKSRLDA